MNDFGRELARLMQVRGIGVRELARAAYCNPGHISNLRSGKARPSPQLAEALDRHLGAEGTLTEIAARSATGRLRRRGTRFSGPSRAVEALQVAMNGNGDGLEVAEGGLAELVSHYAVTVAVTPAVAVYDELVSVRSFAGKLLDRGGRARQAEAPAGTVAGAKLAAQEMRCLAIAGDIAGVSAARRRASTAMSLLGPSAPVSGIYSVPRAEDPPYTATSLLLAGRHGEAAEMTRRIIATAYRPHTRAPGDQPTNYARTLLILALAVAGLGEIDEAAAAGAAALDSGPVVWPTLVLAGKLDKALAAKAPGSAHAADFRARYIGAGTRLTLPAARGGEGSTDD